MTEMYISLKDEAGNELPYHIDQIFSIEGSEQLYCAAVYYGIDAVENETIMLRCELNGSGESTEVYISDIMDADEYAMVASAYEMQARQAAAQSAEEQLAEAEDFITVVDKDGTEHTFIAHLIFEDETNNREYIAVQEVKPDGKIIEEVALYRFKEEGEAFAIDMIPSDMEYERARKVFIELLEADAGALLS